MEASELADDFERQFEKIGSDGWQPIYDGVMDNFRLLSKSLRFAADMEVLMQEHAQPWFEDCVDGQTELRVTIQHEVRYFYGDSIYAVARKAVEALEGGK